MGFRDDQRPREPLPAGEPARLRMAMLAAGLASFSLLYCTQALLPAIGRSFGVGPSPASLTVSATTGAVAVGILPLSSLAESLGRPRVMRTGLAVACAATVLAAAAPSLPLLLAARVVTGLALAGVVAVAMGHLGDEVPGAQVGGAIGLYVSGTSLGGVLGRLVPGTVQDVTSWRVAVLALVAVSGTCAVAFGVLLPPARRFRPEALRLTAHAIAVRELWGDAGVRRLCAAAFLLMGGFVACYNFLGYRLLAPPISLSAAVASLLFLAYLAGTVSSALAGRLADRHGRGHVAVAAVLVSVAGLAGTLPDALPAVALGLVVFTAGFFAAHSVASGWVAARAPGHRAQASALYLMAYYLGSSVLGSAAGEAYRLGGWRASVAAIAAAALLAGWTLAGVDEQAPPEGAPSPPGPTTGPRGRR